MSLSARRAWIEIFSVSLFSGGAEVALRKESVDRNRLRKKRLNLYTRSLSARRAWIEMTLRWDAKQPVIVALREESIINKSVIFGLSLC